MSKPNFVPIDVKNGSMIKAWVKGVPFDPKAEQQLRNTASLPFIFKWVAAMPDVHVGLGATIGSVIPTQKAIIPAAVGVDLGCGMMATRTSLTASDLPENLRQVRSAIEQSVPHGFSARRDSRVGAWSEAPRRAQKAWGQLEPGFKKIVAKRPEIEKSNNLAHMGTLGSGNHFVEVCLDEEDRVWFMLHSGSRGVGNKIGQTFIRLARKEMERHFIKLPDRDLAYLVEGTESFDDYVEAVGFAQTFARLNREVMMANLIDAVRACQGIPPFTVEDHAVNCHHNYVERESHFGHTVWVTRKGAVRARQGELGIIPGSMGARSYIVRGKGNEESFQSCSHGAGRAMSRSEAKRRYTEADASAATEGVECRKDAGVIDEIPMAYKSIEAVMAAQEDLVDIVHTLKQVVCVKG